MVNLRLIFANIFIWLAKISLHHRCDRRVCYCGLIFAADIVPSLSTIQWDLKKPVCESTESSARPLKKKIVSNTKVQFLKKTIDRFSEKLHFWDRHIISYRMVFVVPFEHFMTFRRTVRAALYQRLEPSVPTQEVIEMIELVLDNNNFPVGSSDHYTQVNGKAIGSNLGRNYACAYLGEWETKLLNPRPTGVFL